MIKVEESSFKGIAFQRLDARQSCSDAVVSNDGESDSQVADVSQTARSEKSPKPDWLVKTLVLKSEEMRQR
jgi:hypothetical protein